MAERKKINYKKLVKMVKDGVLQQEIMEQFSFKTSTQLKVAYANALIETGQVPKIKAPRKIKKKKPVDMTVKVNNRGSLTIPKKVVESMKIKKGESFIAKKVPSGVQLKKVLDE